MTNGKTRAQRRKRLIAAAKHLPSICCLCRSSGIHIKKAEHGYVFTYREYRIQWAPSTNKVVVQYDIPGDGNNVPFTKQGQRGKPRIIVALEELVALKKREESHEKA
jgi:hypothetical protein